MTIFKLPDLGEGLPDAEIHAWFVQVGDTVKLDQPLVSMETAKAVVDVPCPQDGVIEALYGKPGDCIRTGQPLVAFRASNVKNDQGTVVGHLEESTNIAPDDFTIGSPPARRAKATPSVRMLAKRLHVSLDAVQGTGEHGVILREDVESFAAANQALPEGFEPLKGVRRAMLTAMVQSHASVVPVSIYDEADIAHWGPQTDITARLIAAITQACRAEPALNAWFDSVHNARKCFHEVHLGLAMDSADGLFVPVLHHAEKMGPETLRAAINRYKTQVQERSIPPEDLKGATITLSNFGKFAGKFASPIIVPPSVAILAVGRLFSRAVLQEDRVEAHRILPLSLSFDHRAVTGGEATRFLGEIIAALEH